MEYQNSKLTQIESFSLPRLRPLSGWDVVMRKGRLFSWLLFSIVLTSCCVWSGERTWLNWLILVPWDVGPFWWSLTTEADLFCFLSVLDTCSDSSKAPWLGTTSNSSPQGGTLLLWCVTCLCPAQTLCWLPSAPPGDLPGLASGLVQVWSPGNTPLVLMSLGEQVDPNVANFTLSSDRIGSRHSFRPTTQTSKSFKLQKTRAKFLEPYKANRLTWLKGGCHGLNVASKFICWSPNPCYLRMWPYLKLESFQI